LVYQRRLPRSRAHLGRSRAQGGDRVAATARKLADIADLEEHFGDAVLPLALDVTDAGQVARVVERAHAHFGKLDVVLNNAGYTLIGTTEEASEADVWRTGRKKLIVAGLTNHVGTVFPSISATEDGYDVQVVVDAGGSPTQVAASRTWSAAAARSKSFSVRTTSTA